MYSHIKSKTFFHLNPIVNLVLIISISLVSAGCGGDSSSSIPAINSEVSSDETVAFEGFEGELTQNDLAAKQIFEMNSLETTYYINCYG